MPQLQGDFTLMHLPLLHSPTETGPPKTHFDVLDHGEPESEVENFHFFPSPGSTTYRGSEIGLLAESQPLLFLATAQKSLFPAANIPGCGSPLVARSVLTATHFRPSPGCGSLGNPGCGSVGWPRMPIFRPPKSVIHRRQKPWLWLSRSASLQPSI